MVLTVLTLLFGLLLILIGLFFGRRVLTVAKGNLFPLAVLQNGQLSSERNATNQFMKARRKINNQSKFNTVITFLLMGFGFSSTMGCS